MENPQYKQIQFYCTEKEIQSMEDLKETLRYRCRADVIRRAIELFEMIIKTQKSGGKLGFKDKDGEMNWVTFLV